MSSLENGLRILDLLDTDRPTLKVGEVAQELGLPKASVSRTLKILADAHYLKREEAAGTYSVGIRPVALSRLFFERQNLLNLVAEAVSDLVDEFGFTGHAGIVSEADRILLVSQQGWYPLQHSGKIAERRFALDSVIGHAILARKADDEVLTQLGFGASVTQVRGFDERKVRSILENARKQPVLLTRNLVTIGVSSIGAAVGDPLTREVIGFCLSFPSSAANHAARQRISQAVYNRALSIGKQVEDPKWILP